jgi:peptidoglycan/LPS O-acetylase OafA/YrhL
MAALRVPAIPALLLYVPFFLGGVVGYRLWAAPRLQIAPWAWPLAITLCIGIRAAAQIGTFSVGAVVASAWLTCLLLGSAVPQFRELRPGVVRTLAAQIAQYSYGIYLSQCAVFWIAFVVLRAEPAWVRGAVCAVLSILLPLVLYHLIEKPMITLGARTANRLADGSVGAVGP